MIVEQNMADESEEDEEAFTDDNGEDELEYDGSEYSSENEIEAALEK